MRTIRMIAGGWLTIWLVACGGEMQASDGHSLEADLAAIAEFNRRYVQAINDGDLDTLSALTTDGHVLITPNSAPLVGREAKEAAMSRVFEQFDIDETWTPVETVVSGDLAYQRGTYRVIATPKAGGERRDVRGNFLRVYHRQPDGEWRMIRDMFNSEPSGGDDQAAAL